MGISRIGHVAFARTVIQLFSGGVEAGKRKAEMLIEKSEL